MITRTIKTERLAATLCLELVQRSAWFEFTPLPCDEYEFKFKPEHLSWFDAFQPDVPLQHSVSHHADHDNTHHYQPRAMPKLSVSSRRSQWHLVDRGIRQDHPIRQ